MSKANETIKVIEEAQFTGLKGKTWAQNVKDIESSLDVQAGAWFDTRVDGDRLRIILNQKTGGTKNNYVYVESNYNVGVLSYNKLKKEMKSLLNSKVIKDGYKKYSAYGDGLADWVDKSGLNKRKLPVWPGGYK